MACLLTKAELILEVKVNFYYKNTKNIPIHYN